jgi:hypothetical protein
MSETASPAVTWATTSEGAVEEAARHLERLGYQVLARRWDVCPFATAAGSEAHRQASRHGVPSEFIAFVPFLCHGKVEFEIPVSILATTQDAVCDMTAACCDLLAGPVMGDAAPCAPPPLGQPQPQRRLLPADRKRARAHDPPFAAAVTDQDCHRVGLRKHSDPPVRAASEKRFVVQRGIGSALDRRRPVGDATGNDPPPFDEGGCGPVPFGP